MEDDYDGEYRYNGTPLMPLAALDNRHRVIYIGSFSKVMYPALRLGYMVVPQQLVEPLNLLRTLSTRQPPMNDQQVMASFISEGISSLISGECAELVKPSRSAAGRVESASEPYWRDAGSGLGATCGDYAG